MPWGGRRAQDFALATLTEWPIILHMRLNVATVAENGQLVLPEELKQALGVPHGGQIEIAIWDGHIELRRLHAGTVDHEPEDPQARARHEDAEFARRTSGCSALYARHGLSF